MRLPHRTQRQGRPARSRVARVAGVRLYDGAISPTAQSAPKIRDADRSRDALLDAAEDLFATHGYDGVSLGEIAAAAGLSRGAPNYFFGSKEHLYTNVLERTFALRQEATAAAIQPVVTWCEHGSDAAGLRRALAAGMEGYMAFLLDHPSFARLVTWEELAGGQRLARTDRRSSAIADAFKHVQAVARQRGLGRFQVHDAVLLFISLTFAPLSYRHTLLVSLERDLSVPRVRKRHITLAVDQMMHLLGA